MYHQTHFKLLSMTDHADFQQLVLDLLACAGYTGVNGRNLSLVDAGRDGLSYFCEETESWVVFSLQRQWKARFRRDWERALDTRRPVRRFIFCTNRTVPAKEIEALVQTGAGYQIQVHLFDGETLRQALDTACTDVRQTYLGLPDRTTSRRLIRYLVSDPEGEVPEPETATVETLFPESRMARGLYALLRTEELTDICETGDEVRALTGVLDAYIEFRRSARAAESAARSLVPGSTPEQVRAHFAGGQVRPELTEAWERVVDAAGALGASVRLVRETPSLTHIPRLSPAFPQAEPYPFSDEMRLDRLPQVQTRPES